MRCHARPARRLQIDMGLGTYFWASLTDLTAQGQAAGFVFRFQPGLDFGAGARRDHPAQPVTTRHMLATSEFLPYRRYAWYRRHNAPVDLGAHYTDARCPYAPCRQKSTAWRHAEGAHFPTWGEDIDLLPNMSILTVSMNSMGSCTSCCHSSRRRSQAKRSLSVSQMGSALYSASAPQCPLRQSGASPRCESQARPAPHWALPQSWLSD